MANFLQNACAWLEGIRASSLSTPVTYRRGGASGTSKPLNVTIGATSETIVDLSGVPLELRLRDYLIAVADFSAAGFTWPPVLGDQVIEFDSSIFEVVTQHTEGPWRWHDPFRQTVRIHTKQVVAVIPGPLPP